MKNPLASRWSPVTDENMTLAGHYALPVILFGLGTTVVLDVLGQPGGWVRWAGGLTVGIVLWCLYCDIRMHMRHLCERCAGSTPLDPQKAVNRWRPSLWAVHNRLNLLVIALLMLAVTADGFFRMGNAAHAAVDIPVQLCVAAVVLSSHKHVRLQPWCPYCRWDDGGAKEPSPEVPDPALSK